MRIELAGLVGLVLVGCTNDPIYLPSPQGIEAGGTDAMGERVEGRASIQIPVNTETMKDAWKEAAAKEGPEGTFHGFRGTPGQARIDWILFRGPWSVKSARTVTANQDGRYPSDHFPVLAELEW